MAIDPRNLRPADVCRALNSTPLGTVITERRLRQHRNRAGMRVASATDANRVDLLRYAAWLVSERHAPKPEPEGLAGYDAHRERARARNMAMSLSGRDIGELPEVKDPERRSRCEQSFRQFCETYFPQTFTLDWSDDHLKVIAKIEQAVLEGGLFAMAMPRGSGKALALDTPLPTTTAYKKRGEYVQGPLSAQARVRRGSDDTVVSEEIRILREHGAYTIRNDNCRTDGTVLAQFVAGTPESFEVFNPATARVRHRAREMAREAKKAGAPNPQPRDEQQQPENQWETAGKWGRRLDGQSTQLGSGRRQQDDRGAGPAARDQLSPLMLLRNHDPRFTGQRQAVSRQ